MRAIQIDQYGGEDQLKIVDIPQPSAGKGEVLVRIAATTLNPIDQKRTSGAMRQVMPLQFPHIPGGDFSGRVEAVGEAVTQFRRGEQVFGYSGKGGAYAEFIAIDADNVAPRPKSLNEIEAASLALVAQTALQLIERARIQEGQTVLIQGAGGAVGSIAVQLAHRLGAMVIGTAARASFDRLKKYGANELIDYQAERFENRVKGVDAVLDAVGGDVLQRSFAILKPGGVLVSIVQAPSEEQAKKSNVKASLLVTESSAESLHEVAQLADGDDIKPYIGKVYPFREVAKGWRDGRLNHVEGKIVFQVAAEAGRAARASE